MRRFENMLNARPVLGFMGNKIRGGREARIITLVVRPPDFWWDNSRQRRNEKYAVHGQKLCEESFVHINWMASSGKDCFCKRKRGQTLYVVIRTPRIADRLGLSKYTQQKTLRVGLGRQQSSDVIWSTGDRLKPTSIPKNELVPQNGTMADMIA